MLVIAEQSLLSLFRPISSPSVKPAHLLCFWLLLTKKNLTKATERRKNLICLTAEGETTLHCGSMAKGAWGRSRETESGLNAVTGSQPTHSPSNSFLPRLQYSLIALQYSQAVPQLGACCSNIGVWRNISHSTHNTTRSENVPFSFRPWRREMSHSVDYFMAGARASV